MDPLSLVAEHCANCGQTFAFQNAEILGRGNDRITRETSEAWHTGANSINRSIALPKAYEALRTQLSEQKSRIRLRQDRNPSTAESMGDTRAAVLQPESDKGAIVITASSSTYLAGVRTNDRSKANGPDEGAIITATHAADDLKNWTDYLTLVLLGIRSALKPQLNWSPAPQSDFLKDLATCSNVDSRCDRVRRPLAPAYDDPFRVLSRGTKTLHIPCVNREEVVSVDCLKGSVLDFPSDEPCGPLPSAPSTSFNLYSTVPYFPSFPLSVTSNCQL
nr:unnamed protein product [Spirometra erinaceieuropaei]